MAERPCSFAFEWYLEDGGFDEVKGILEKREYPYAYALHDKDTGDNGVLKKPHYHVEVRVPGGMSLSAFKKNVGIRYAEPLKSWEGYCVYLVHADRESKQRGKFQYPIDIIKGTMSEEAIKVINKALGNNQKKKSEDDKGIIQILEFIESMDYCTTACLVRWCCQNNLYSVYRRAGRIVADLLAEHNRNCQFTLQDTIYQMKLEAMEKRLTVAEKELERAYGDFTTKVTNPFTGKVIADNDVYEKSLRDMMKGLEEIQKGA